MILISYSLISVAIYQTLVSCCTKTIVQTIKNFRNQNLNCLSGMG